MLVSHSPLTESYGKQLAKTYSLEKVNNADASWIRFIRDHRLWLIRNGKCTSVEVTEADRRVYRYRIRDYLKYKGYPASLETAFRIVNRFSSDMDFNDAVDYVWVPTTEAVNDLYFSYRTLITKVNSL